MSANIWMLTASGAEFFLSGIGTASNELLIEDIAHAGAQINRYTGHARRPNCINEHQLLCADIAERLNLSVHVQLACLVHDGHEAYTGDVSSPVKWTVGEAWANFEKPIARQMRKALGLTSVFTGHGRAIHHIDLMALATERRDLLNWRAGHNLDWPVLDTPGSQVPAAKWVCLDTVKREQMHWTEWRSQWLGRYHALHEQCAQREARDPGQGAAA